jgi:hypothetical protein
MHSPLTLESLLKFEILATGLRVTSSAKDFLIGRDETKKAKLPIRTRSGVSGGLDLYLGQDVFVNAPTEESFASDSEVALDCTHGTKLVVRRGDDELLIPEPLPEPQFYSQVTADRSQSLRRIAQMCSPDRLCYGMTGPGCSFWHPDAVCRYCSIGQNYEADAVKKQARHLLEVVRAAVQDPLRPAKHLLLGGGTPPGEDMGALLAADLCRKVKQEFPDLSIYVMIVAPLHDHYIDALFDSGVDELGLNLEFWSSEAWQEFIPGKDRRVGRKRFIEALAHVAKLFGPMRSRSILIAGLEPINETLKAVDVLSSMSVMPIISPFRPLTGTPLENRRGFDLQQYEELFLAASEIVEDRAVPLGPTCICCQNNTLTLPIGTKYHYY